MQAIVRDEYGTADVLQCRDVPRPTVASDTVLVRVRAASVGAWDWHDMTGEPLFMRLTNMGLRRPKRQILGLDFAGQVAAVGASVSHFQPGDLVYGECKGTHAEYTTATEDQLGHAPTSLNYVEAAAVPIAGSTALLGLREKAQLQPGESVLIVGAAGGVGTFAVQIANAMKAKVTAVCRPESAGQVRALGADKVIDYTQENFTQLGERYDVILQIAGSASAWACRRALKPDGRLILCSGDGGGRFLGPLARMATAMLLSPFVRQKIKIYVATVNPEILSSLTDLIDAGQVTPVVDAVYPLHEAAEAMRRFSGHHGPGKIVLTLPTEE